MINRYYLKHLILLLVISISLIHRIYKYYYILLFILNNCKHNINYSFTVIHNTCSSSLVYYMTKMRTKQYCKQNNIYFRFLLIEYNQFFYKLYNNNNNSIAGSSQQNGFNKKISLVPSTENLFQISLLRWILYCNMVPVHLYVKLYNIFVVTL